MRPPHSGFVAVSVLVVFTIFVVLITAAVIRSTQPKSDAAAHGTEPDDSTSVTNGVVLSATSDGVGGAYVGGSFSWVGPYDGRGIPISTSTGQPVGTFARVNDGAVHATVSDGAGGWYVGGTFTLVGATTRNRIVHILADGSIDPAFDPNADGTVRALALSGSTLYVGGTFTNIGGQTRNNIAAINTGTGLATAWDPNSDVTVSTLLLNGTTLYAGGFFANIGGQPRSLVAALDTTTGLATAFNPTATGTSVNTLVLNGTTLYAGGIFSNMGGQVRNNIAAVSTVTGLATAFDANSDSNVNAMALGGSTLYVGGGFSSIGGQARTNLAGLDPTTGAAGGFAAGTSNHLVNALLVDGTTLYVGGIFTLVDGNTRNRIAAFDTTSGLATSFNPSAAGAVNTLALDGTTLYVGGELIGVNGITRNNIAHVQADGTVDPDFDPNASSNVNTFVLDGVTLYVGGAFTTIGGQSRNRLAALDTATGLATAFNPNATTGSVNALVLDGVLYVGGNFTNIGGQARNRLAAIDTGTGLATSFNPGISGGIGPVIHTLLLDGTTLYSGGNFTTAGGQARNRLAAIDTGTGLATTFNPNSSSVVRALLLDGTTLYVAGDFATIGGQTRNRIAALDTATGLATSFDPNASGGSVLALGLVEDILYVGGSFTTIGGQPRNRLAAIDTATGLATDWDPNLNSTVNVLILDGTILYLGGNFTNVSMVGTSFFARLALTTVQFASATQAGSESQVNALLPVTLSQADVDDVTVDYAVTGGSATGGGVDYTLADGTLTILAGSTTANIALTVVDDSAIESIETVEVTLVTSSGNATLEAPTVTTYSIQDNDTASVSTPTDSQVTRISDGDVIGLAVAVSKAGFAADGSADGVLLGRHDLVVDEFAATSLASLINGPVLLTPTATLDERTKAEIDRALGPNGKGKPIFILGGTQAIADSVLESLSASGYTQLTRLAGSNRRATAAAVAGQVAASNPTQTTVAFLSEGEALVDAFSEGPAAGTTAGDGRVDYQLLNLRGSTTLAPETQAFLDAHPEVSTLYMMGGTSALPEVLRTFIAGRYPNLTITRFDGTDRFDTNAKVSNHFFPSPAAIYVANGQSVTIPGALQATAVAGTGSFGALLAGATAAKNTSPLMLVTVNDIPDATTAYIIEHLPTIQTATIIGGIDVVGSAVEAELRALLQ